MRKGSKMPTVTTSRPKFFTATEVLEKYEEQIKKAFSGTVNTATEVCPYCFRVAVRIESTLTKNSASWVDAVGWDNLARDGDIYPQRYCSIDPANPTGSWLVTDLTAGKVEAAWTPEGKEKPVSKLDCHTCTCDWVLILSEGCKCGGK